MSDENKQELQTLKDLAASLTTRIHSLEQRLSAPAGVAPPRPSAARVVAASSQPKESFESRVGRFWLQRVGIGSLVLGVAFFILYTFQYLGPWAKLAIGYAVGGGLLGLGILIERQQGLAWYGRGLRGGGWAVVYFTTYAMHHIPGTRVLQDPTASLLLLLLVAAMAVGSALKRRSQLEAAFAFLLAFATMFVSHATLFTLGSVAVLTVAIVTVAVQMRWANLCLTGAVGSHVAHLVLAHRMIGLNLIFSDYPDIAVEQFWLNAAFLALYWVAYTYAVFKLGGGEGRNRRPVLTTTLVNSLLFGLQLLASVPRAYWDERYLAPLLLGVACLALSLVARRRGLIDVAEANVLLGLSWATASVPLKLTSRWVECLWGLEVAALVRLGLQFRRWTYRVFAIVLAVLLVPRLLLELMGTATIVILSHPVSQRLLIILTAVGSYGAAAAAYRLERFRVSQGVSGNQCFHLYASLASFFLTCLVAAEVAARWLSLALALDGMGLLALGFWVKDRVLRTGGLIVFAILVLKILLVDLAQAETIYRILSFLAAGAVMLAASYAYARFEALGSAPKKPLV
jgi:uncharacterized membrane protein